MSPALAGGFFTVEPLGKPWSLGGLTLLEVLEIGPDWPSTRVGVLVEIRVFRVLTRAGEDGSGLKGKA